MSKIYDDRQAVAFAGMKGDSGDDRVETFAAEGQIPFGTVVTVGTKPTQAKLGGTAAIGIALHSHAVVKQYEKYDAVSVMTRGLAWCAVKGDDAVTERGEVKFDPATGLVSDAASATLTNAIFRSGVVTTPFGKIALVELHAPQK